jgi:hypothetical protein
MTEATTNTEVTYSTLKDNFLAWLQTSCDNIGSYSSRVPDALINSSYSKSSSSEIKSVKNLGWTMPPAYASYWGSFSIIERINSSTIVPVVALSTINSEFSSFMSARGIDTASNTPVITTGLLAFWNNVAAFCSARLINVGSKYATNALRFYVSGSDYHSVPTAQEIAQDDTYTAAQVTMLLNNFEAIIEQTSKARNVVYNFNNVVCSCSCSSSSCSSSCSSSSSSSSSSSCSSIFIAYMKLL